MTTEILPYPITKEIKARRHQQALDAHYDKEINRIFDRLSTPLQQLQEDLRT